MALCAETCPGGFVRKGGWSRRGCTPDIWFPHAHPFHCTAPSPFGCPTAMDEAAAGVRWWSREPWIPISLRGDTSNRSVCTLTLTIMPRGSPACWGCLPATCSQELRSPQGICGGKVEGLIFILWDCFPSLFPSPPPFLPHCAELESDFHKGD